MDRPSGGAALSPVLREFDVVVTGSVTAGAVVSWALLVRGRRDPGG